MFIGLIKPSLSKDSSIYIVAINMSINQNKKPNLGFSNLISQTFSFDLGTFEWMANDLGFS